MRYLALALLVLASPVHAQVEQGRPNAGFTPAFEAQTRASALPATAVQVDRFVGGLEHPWGIASLPEGRFLVTERPGRMRLIGPDGVSEPIAGLPDVDARRQGGLLDVAVRADFAQTRQVWWTYAKPLGRRTATAVATGELSADGTRMENVRDILVGTPAQSPMHYGSRIVFGPDGMAYVTTGEHSSQQERVLAQDTGTTLGKVLRLTPEGAIPADNPFVGAEGMDAIWSYGHRNPQGAAMAPDGSLWAVEHGPAGGDELNLIGPGRNYGWPVISYGVNYNRSPVGQGIAVQDGMEQPVYYWDPVIAPAGMMFHNGGAFDWQGDLLIGSLNPGGLVRLRIEDDQIVGEERLVGDIGRVRDVEVLDDGSVLLLIDDPDGGIMRLTPG